MLFVIHVGKRYREDSWKGTFWTVVTVVMPAHTAGAEAE